jgi:hypothetical protein
VTFDRLDKLSVWAATLLCFAVIIGIIFAIQAINEPSVPAEPNHSCSVNPICGAPKLPSVSRATVPAFKPLTVTPTTAQQIVPLPTDPNAPPNTPQQFAPAP